MIAYRVVGARSTSPEETRVIAAALAREARPGDVVLLAGELGAGKTTFAKGFAAGLGIREAVTSPTFTLLRPYACPPSERGVRTLLHADVYRLDHMGEVIDLAIGELVEEGAVALVEWGDVAAAAYGSETCTVRLSGGPSENDRDIEIEPSRSAVSSWGERTGAVVTALAPWGRS